MVRIALFAAQHGREFGQGRGDKVGVSQQRALHIAAAQQTGQLLTDALGGNAVQAMHLPPHGSGGFRLDGKTQLGCEAQSAQDAQRVLLKSGVCITDRDQVIAAAGGMKRDLVGTPVTGALEAIMNEREHVLLNPPSGTPIKITRDDPGEHYPQVISPILCEGDVIGAVILRSRDSSHSMGKTEQILARCAAGFMGRQMEQ